MFKVLTSIFTIPVALAQQAADKTLTAGSETSGQIQGLAESIIHAIPLWITGGIVIVASFVVARIVKSSVENKMTEQGFEEDHREIQIVASRASSAGVLILGITIGLKIAGIDLTSIIAAGAFGIGFAMKDFIMNFFAGIIVLLQKQFTIGDWIKIGGTTGIIEAIQSRYTVIRNFDGTKVIIPNADLFKKQVTNLTSNPYRRFQIDIKVDLYLNLREVIDVILEAASKVKSISPVPKLPSIRALKPGAYYNNLRIRCWVVSRKGTLKPQSDLVKEIHRQFYKRGWSFPYPMEKIMFDKDIQPDVEARSANYIKNSKHKFHRKNPLVPSPQALAQEAGFIKQQQAILAENTQEPTFEAPQLYANLIMEQQNQQVVQNQMVNSSEQQYIPEQSFSLAQPPLVVEQPIPISDPTIIEIGQPPLTNLPDVEVQV